jgi:hypothetical protein
MTPFIVITGCCIHIQLSLLSFQILCYLDVYCFGYGCTILILQQSNVMGHTVYGNVKAFNTSSSNQIRNDDTLRSLCCGEFIIIYSVIGTCLKTRLFSKVS